MPQLPLDQAGIPVQTTPAERANASSATSTTSGAAVDLALTAWTRRIEVTTISAHVFINYTDKATDAVTATSFDKVILTNERQLLVLPAGTETINMLGSGNGTVYVVEYA